MDIPSKRTSLLFSPPFPFPFPFLIFFIFLNSYPLLFSFHLEISESPLPEKASKSLRLFFKFALESLCEIQKGKGKRKRKVEATKKAQRVEGGGEMKSTLNSLKYRNHPSGNKHKREKKPTANHPTPFSLQGAKLSQNRAKETCKPLPTSHLLLHLCSGYSRQGKLHPFQI